MDPMKRIIHQAHLPPLRLLIEKNKERIKLLIGS